MKTITVNSKTKIGDIVQDVGEIIDIELEENIYWVIDDLGFLEYYKGENNENI